MVEDIFDLVCRQREGAVHVLGVSNAAPHERCGGGMRSCMRLAVWT